MALRTDRIIARERQSYKAETHATHVRRTHLAIFLWTLVTDLVTALMLAYYRGTAERVVSHSMRSMRLPWTADRYVELEEAPAVLTPLHPTTVLLPEHFSTPLPQLRYPVKLDFSHERFRLRSLSLLSQLKDTALQEIDLSDNELQSLTELNRCSALKTLCARRNSLASGAGVLLTVHRLTRLDLSDNRLTELPPLKELTNLQVGGASTPREHSRACSRGPRSSEPRPHTCAPPLYTPLSPQVLNISRNRISEGWGEIVHCVSLQALDASQNQLDWHEVSPLALCAQKMRTHAHAHAHARMLMLQPEIPEDTHLDGSRWQDTGELRRAMVVLRGLKRLRVLNLSQNPTSFRKGYRSWVLANARRLEVFDNAGVSEAEREGDDVASRVIGEPQSRKGARPEEASPVHKTFGVPLAELLEHDVATLPRLVQECTRHVQERSPSDKAVLTADGDPSVVLLLRNAFERGGDAGQIALLDCMDGSSDADVRAACSVLRSFLLELPQPVVPVEFYLPLLEAASGRASVPSDGSQIEDLLAPMPQEHWALLEHVLCFLVNASRPFPEAGFQQLLARVWAPCILRAPARIMSQFQGKVIDAMATCILRLLDLRRGQGDAAPAESGLEDNEAVGIPSSPQRASLQVLAAEPAVAQLVDLGDQNSPQTGPAASAGADAPDPPEMLAKQRASADELLSALEELQDDCSLLDDASATTGAPTTQFISEDVPAPVSPNKLFPPTSPLEQAKQLEQLLMPASPLAKQEPASPIDMINLSAPGLPNAEALRAAPSLQGAAASCCMAMVSPPEAARLPQAVALNLRERAQADDDTASNLSTSSHRMAVAAAAALDAREAEASKLKQRAQRLLRERSELAIELERLQDTLSRLERTAARSREQAQALRAERAKFSTSDSRRHSTQLGTLSKAVLREKQRRLSARNDVGALQRQLGKKRTHHQAVAARRTTLTREREERGERQSRAEAPSREMQRLSERLRQCQHDLAELGSRQDIELSDSDADQQRQAAELEAHLTQLKRVAAQQNERLPSSAGGDRRSTQLAEQSHSVRQALTAEQTHARGAAPALEASTGAWRRLHELVRETVVGSSNAVSSDAVADAAKWHAEARAFAAEARRVRRLHGQAVHQRDAERQGCKLTRFAPRPRPCVSRSPLLPMTLCLS